MSPKKAIIAFCLGLFLSWAVSNLDTLAEMVEQPQPDASMAGDIFIVPGAN